MIRIIGIDPGLANTGYGIIESGDRGFTHIAHGAIRTPAHSPTGERLKTIYDEIRAITLEFKPVAAGVESLYFAKNISSAIPVAQARGVVLLVLEEMHIQASEFPPQAIKQTIHGSGRAEKHQVQELVRVFLGLEEIPKPDHAADALAAAICCYQMLQLPQELRGG